MYYSSTEKLAIIYVNDVNIRSWNKPVLSIEVTVSCSRKQRQPLMRFELKPDRHSQIVSHKHQHVANKSSYNLKKHYLNNLQLYHAIYQIDVKLLVCVEVYTD